MSTLAKNPLKKGKQADSCQTNTVRLLKYPVHSFFLVATYPNLTQPKTNTNAGRVPQVTRPKTGVREKQSPLLDCPRSWQLRDASSCWIAIHRPVHRPVGNTNRRPPKDLARKLNKEPNRLAGSQVFPNSIHVLKARQARD